MNRAISPFGTPIFVNIVTDMLFTTKYGIPSAKYTVEINNHEELAPDMPMRLFINHYR